MERLLNIADLAPDGTRLFCREATLASLKLDLFLNHNLRPAFIWAEVGSFKTGLNCTLNCA
jgi:hypothetical protein